MADHQEQRREGLVCRYCLCMGFGAWTRARHQCPPTRSAPHSSLPHRDVQALGRKWEREQWRWLARAENGGELISAWFDLRARPGD